MKRFFLILLAVLLCTVTHAQNIRINRPAHDGSRYIGTDFDICGESVKTELGEYSVEVGMAYFRSTSGKEDWYILMSLILENNPFEFVKDDRLLIKTKAGRTIELMGLYNYDSHITETISQTFGFRSPYFLCMYQREANFYRSTQWFKISEEDVMDICKGIELLRLETSLNPCTIERKEAKNFFDNIKYGYKKIKDAAAGPDFYDQFR